MSRIAVEPDLVLGNASLSGTYIYITFSEVLRAGFVEILLVQDIFLRVTFNLRYRDTMASPLPTPVSIDNSTHSDVQS